jgi:hypothetical protein
MKTTYLKTGLNAYLATYKMQHLPHFIYSLFKDGTTQVAKTYCKVLSQHLHRGSEENYEKPDRIVSFPANIPYRYLPITGYHLPQLAQIEIYHFKFGTCTSVTTV